MARKRNVAGRKQGKSAAGQPQRKNDPQRERSPATAQAGAEGPARGPRAKVAERIYQQVESMVASGMTRADAFRKISQETGRSGHSVQTNYYRARKRLARGKGAARGAARASAASPARRGRVHELLERARGVLAELAQAVRDQEKEIQRLREESSRLETLRRVIGKL